MKEKEKKKISIGISPNHTHLLCTAMDVFLRAPLFPVNKLIRLTIDRSFPGEDDHNQLEALVGVLEVLEHGLHAVRPLGVLAETGLALDGHARVSRDLPQLVCKGSVKNPV